MADDLTLRQQTALLTLMAQAREMTNTELRDLAGADLDRRDREHLVTLGHLRCWKDRNSYVHELTPSGWAQCREIFTSARRPTRSGSAAGALLTVLAGLEAHLRRTGTSPEEIFRPDVEARIRAAYARAASRRGARVPLAALRETVDATLDRMVGLPDVRLFPEAEQHVLTDDDRKAALEIGGQPHHLLAIGGV